MAKKLERRRTPAKKATSKKVASAKKAMASAQKKKLSVYGSRRIW